MDKEFMSKSRYCNCVQCEKIYWLNRYKKEEMSVEGNDSTLKKGRQVGEFAKGLFGDYSDVPVDCDISLRTQKTQELLQEKPNVIAEASFIHDNNFCSVDILKNDEGGVEIYEVKSSTEVKDIYLDDVAYQYFVLSNSGLNVKKASIVYINKEYVRGKELDINQVFNIEDVTEICLQKQAEIKDMIDFINEYMKSHGESEPAKDIGKHCFNPYMCSFWDYCTRDLPKPNVFDIRGMQTRSKLKKYNEGKVSFEDLENEGINPKYLEQIDFELHDREPKIIKDAISDFLSSLKYPLYFIDYEACQYAIPEYEGTRPYQQIPFQYSLHIVREKGAPVEHKEFLAEIDDDNLIRTFAESMISDLPENGSVIVYNRTFEESHVNKKLAEMFPDLADEIERINSNIVDLMVPFKNRDYYVRQMKGSYSIKYVLPALYPGEAELDYTNLPVVHNGSEASDAFLELKDKTPEKQAEIRKGLLKYCELDTWAMVKIWEKFREVTG